MNGFNINNSFYDTPDKLDDNTYSLYGLNRYPAWVQTPQVGSTLNRMANNPTAYDAPDKLDDNTYSLHGLNRYPAWVQTPQVGPILNGMIDNSAIYDVPDKVGPDGAWNPNPNFNFPDFSSYYSSMFPQGYGSSLLDAIFGAGAMNQFLQPPQYDYPSSVPAWAIVDAPDKL